MGGKTHLLPEAFKLDILAQLFVTGLLSYHLCFAIML